jgi:hypothetical protein
MYSRDSPNARRTFSPPSHLAFFLGGITAQRYTAGGKGCGWRVESKLHGATLQVHDVGGVQRVVTTRPYALGERVCLYGGEALPDWDGIWCASRLSGP